MARRRVIDSTRLNGQTSEYARKRVPAAEAARVLKGSTLRKLRVQGMPDAQRTRSLACNRKARKQVTTGTPKRSGIPCAMVLRLIPCSPRCTGLVVTVAGGLVARQLDPSVGGSGPHGFAVRIFSARRALPTRPPHPCPRFLTIAKRPSCGRDARRGATDLPDGTSGFFFAKGLDRISDNRHVGQISRDARYQRPGPGLGILGTRRVMRG